MSETKANYDSWLIPPVPTHRVTIDTDEHGVYLLRMWAEHEWRNMKVTDVKVLTKPLANP